MASPSPFHSFSGAHTDANRSELKDKVNTPIVFVVFNRPEATRTVFDAIANARPERLLVVADGFRADRPGEADRCAAVREIVSKVDWPCRVETNFADANMGCRRRVISGLNWAFSLVEEAIVLEDDCLPDQSFFLFCAELLERFRHNPKIGMIAGFNYEGSFRYPYSYYFSPLVPIWGWATWRRAWQQYDEHMESWPGTRREGLLERLFPSRRVVGYWEKTFDSMHSGTGPNTWDYQWTFTNWSHNWLNIVPATNMVENIGFGNDATHTTKANSLSDIKADVMKFPLRHPPTVSCWQTRTMTIQKKVFSPSMLRRLQEKISRLSFGG
jgi:hypothetical protein